MATVLTSALIIFFARAIEISLSIFRLIYTVRGNRGATWVLGFVSSLLFVSVVRQVFTNLDNWWNVFGYSLGFATGTLIGMWLESRMVSGYGHLRIISPGHGDLLRERLEEMGVEVLKVPARGRDGMVALLECNIPRRDILAVTALVQQVDDEAFITSEKVRVLAGSRMLQRSR